MLLAFEVQASGAHQIPVLEKTRGALTDPVRQGKVRYSASQIVWRTALLEVVAARAVPTLIVRGDKDRLFPVAHLDAARTRLPHARTHLFRDTGHVPQIERADEFAAPATGFWTALPPA